MEAKLLPPREGVAGRTLHLKVAHGLQGVAHGRLILGEAVLPQGVVFGDGTMQLLTEGLLQTVDALLLLTGQGAVGHSLLLTDDAPQGVDGLGERLGGDLMFLLLALELLARALHYSGDNAVDVDRLLSDLNGMGLFAAGRIGHYDMGLLLMVLLLHGTTGEQRAQGEGRKQDEERDDGTDEILQRKALQFLVVLLGGILRQWVVVHAQRIVGVEVIVH